MTNSIPIIHRDNIENTRNNIIQKKISVSELVKEHIDLAKQINPKINAFITILEEEALSQAALLDKRINDGEEKILNKKLLGIPFTVKDLYLVKGTKTTFASKYMDSFVAPYTATVVQNCLDEGAILIGKCNCDPWGFGGSGENSGYGATKHPMDLSRTPGGSSSGSAASLLAGVGYFSLGTDTGGSVRLPASFCGLYGLKPTYGRNSRFGIGSMGSSFDTPGFFARYFEDIKLLESIMEGKDINDSSTYDLNLMSSTEKKVAVIGVPFDLILDGVDVEVKDKILEYIDKISKYFRIKEIKIDSAKYGLAVYYVLVPSEIASNRAKYDGVRYGPFISENYEDNLVIGRSKYFEKEVKRRIMIGTFSLSSGYADQYYKKASLVRQKIKREFKQIFSSEVDLIIMPVSPTTAFKLGEKSSDPVQMYLVDIFTVLANLAGIPSLSIPIGSDSCGMPIGVQIMADHFMEQNIYQYLEKCDHVKV
jgi:aspartyl-tRNA(Asn)/glutamyl-tRNA(Gln) amidotransferase subunit A